MNTTFETKIDEANRAFQDGDLDGAARRCADILEVAPDHAGAHALLGTIRLSSGEFDAAAMSFRRAIASDPGAFEARRGLGVALASLGHPDDAVASFRAALAIEPNHAEAHYDLGVLFLESGQLADATDSLSKAIEARPDFTEAHFNLAVALVESGKLEAAVARYQRVLQLAPDFVEAHFNLGIVLGKLNRHAAAVANFQKVIRAMPDLPEAHLNLGVALGMSGHSDSGLKSLRRAVELKPDYAEAHKSLGVALTAAGSAEEALACHRRAIEIDSDYVEAHFGLAAAADAAQRDGLALTHLRRALAIDPDHLDSLRAIGGLLTRLRRYAEAAEFYRRASALAPLDAEPLCAFGDALAHSGESERALGTYREALALKPDLIAAHVGIVAALTTARRLEEAILAAETAVAAQPTSIVAVDMLADLKRHVCDWRDMDKIHGRLADAVKARWGDVVPFWFLAIIDDPAAHHACAQQFARTLPESTPRRGRVASPAREKLRIGYFSRFLNHHATAYLMVDLFETHDRARFETNLISFGHDDESPMRRRVERAADRFLDLAGEPDETIAARIQDAKIDIVIDLDGHTRSNRLAVLARRPAPVQVTFLGYPGTLGTDFIDYIIADEFVLPPDQHQNFSEKVVYLPDTYQPCDRQRTFAPTPTRRECGLPEQGFVFCCFNNSYKITPDVFDIWARILNAVPGSVLWLLAQSDLAAENLRREAQARGVDPNRLVFGSGLGTAEHLARHRLADLVLDTMPYNAHTTANDALFAGLPVLTRVGKAFPARVAGSLLRAVDMPELITESAEEYEHLAIAIARDPARHVALRDRLRRNIATSPLFDTERFARKIEAAYLQMADISRRGEEPRSFAVD